MKKKVTITYVHFPFPFVVFTHSKRDERLAKKLTTRILPVFMADGHIFELTRSVIKEGKSCALGESKKKEKKR